MKKGECRSQVSTEYMIIVIMALAFIIPVIIIYMQYSNEGSDSITSNKVEKIMDDLVMAINTVYSYGEDSETTLLMKLPKGIEEIRFEGNEVLFRVRFSGSRVNEMVKVTGASLANCVIIRPSTGTHKMIVKKIYNPETGGEMIGLIIDGNNC